MTVVVESIVANEDGTFTGVLVRDDVRVQCEGMAWWDACEDEELEAIYEEWQWLADAGEDGYAIL